MRTAEEQVAIAVTRCAAAFCGVFGLMHIGFDFLQQSGLVVPAVFAAGIVPVVAFWWDEIKESLRDFKENMR